MNQKNLSKESFEIRRRSGLIPLFVKTGQNKAIGAEIGVEKGRFSDEILNNPGIAKLYSIDVWSDLEGNFCEDIYRQAEQNLKKHKNRSVMIKGDSVSVSKTIKDESLDFVYIDANHSYEAVSEDLASWIKKVVIGGILSGHDYKQRGGAHTKYRLTSKMNNNGHCGVKKAVNDFVANNGYTLFTTKDRPPSWFFVKDH